MDRGRRVEDPLTAVYQRGTVKTIEETGEVRTNEEIKISRFV